MRRIVPACLLFSLIVSGLWGVLPRKGIAQETPNPTPKPQPKLEFNRDIRPILSDKCYFCHGPDSGHRKADLRLDQPNSGPVDAEGHRAIVAGKAELSEFVQRITSSDDTEQMPPPDSGKELSPEEITTLTKWVEQGAEYQPHWAYLPPHRPTVPDVTDATWPLNPIDRFLLHRLETEALKPAPDADRITLIRRVTLDLTGLLPTTQEVADYLQNTSPQAFEKVVDRLLDSPHYGERMAMYWLDLVRYADTVGYHGDQEHPITPYRDYVIEAFSSNLPFDQFTREQIAGDLLAGVGLRQKIASGYNRLLQTSHEGGVQVKEYLHKYDADRVRNVSGVWLGATLGCAECHNHKYDPYTQKSFYQLAAFFADVDDLRTFKGGDSNPTRREPEIVVSEPADELLIQQLEHELQQLRASLAAAKVLDGDDGSEPNPVSKPAPKAPPSTTSSAAAKKAKAKPEDPRLTALQQKLDAVRRRGRRTMVTESITPKVVRVLSRGDWMDETGEIVEPAVPDFLPGLIAKPGQRLNRLDLANWLTTADNPLTSRVFTNRLWYLFFGVGLANSLDDLGAQGEWPTHPQLLDWLSSEFAESGWNVKNLTRLIVTSRAYRQSSAMTPLLAQRDPENRLFARQTQFRLPAEMIRDNALQLSGLLIHREGGTSHPYQPAGYYKFLNFPKRDYLSDKDDNQYRRGVYLHWQRQYLHPMLKAFDASTREECSVRRPISNTPLAALTLLNDPTFLEAAKMFAVRVIHEGGVSVKDRIDWAWKETLQRSPTSEEIAALESLYESSTKLYHQDPAAAKALIEIGLTKTPSDIADVELAAWTNVARALLNLHETITRN